MLRNIVAVIAALIVGNLAIMGAELALSAVYPMGIDSGASEEAMRQAMARMPAGAFVMLIAGWAIGATLEGAVAARISKSAKLPCALIAGGIQTVGAIINLVTIPHPVWLWPSVLLFVSCAWLGARLFGNLSKPSVAPA
jgi:hypothetical protein